MRSFLLPLLCLIASNLYAREGVFEILTFTVASNTLYPCRHNAKVVGFLCSILLVQHARRCYGVNLTTTIPTATTTIEMTKHTIFLYKAKQSIF